MSYKLNPYTGKFDYYDDAIGAFLRDTLNDLFNPTATISGSQTVDSGGAVLGEEGEKVLGEDGGGIADETAGEATTDEAVLGETGEAVLGEEGGKVSGESGILTPMPSQGVATPLMRTSTPCLWADILAKFDNTEKIWVGDENIEEGIGIPISTTSQVYRLYGPDAMNMYIVGLGGEGVTFNIASTAVAVADTGAILGEEGEGILGEEGEKILGEDAEDDDTGVPDNAVLDSDGNPILDSDGNYILEGEE